MAAGLNAPQLDAVKTLKGPLLVLAGAGTGKTRGCYVSHCRVDSPGDEAGADFGRYVYEEGGWRDAGAGERVAEPASGAATPQRKKSAKDAPPAPEISTFHSLCVRILRRHIEQLGYPQRFSICDRNEQESQARTALRELRAPNAALSPGDMLSIVSRWKSASVRPAEAVQIAQSERDQLAAAAYRRYQDNLKRVGTVDFDDLLLLTEELLSNFPAVLPRRVAAV